MKQIITFLIAACATIGTNAQLLYKITGPDLAKPSYLIGTHHLAPVSMLDSIEGFAQALNDVEAVYGEVVQSELTSPEIQQYTMSLVMAPADSTLSKVLTPQQIDSLNVMLNKYTMGMANASAFEPMTPGIVSTQLALLQAMREFPDFNPMEQLDITIQQMAAQQGKTSAGLETAKSQIDKLYGTPISKQADDLMLMVRNDDRSSQLSKQLAQAYRNQDIDALWAIANDPVLAGDDDDMERLIYSRNRQWVNMMPTLMEQQPILFAVGAGHLPSPQGVIALLRQKGYTVEPVSKKF